MDALWGLCRSLSRKRWQMGTDLAARAPRLVRRSVTSDRRPNGVLSAATVRKTKFSSTDSVELRRRSRLAAIAVQRVTRQRCRPTLLAVTRSVDTLSDQPPACHGTGSEDPSRESRSEVTRQASRANHRPAPTSSGQTVRLFIQHLRPRVRVSAKGLRAQTETSANGRDAKVGAPLQSCPRRPAPRKSEGRPL